MTLLTDHKEGKGKSTRALRFYFGVGIIIDVGMAIHAHDAFIRVNRVAELRGIDRCRDHILAEFEIQTILLMTREAKIIGGFVFLINWCGLNGRHKRYDGIREKKQSQEQGKTCPERNPRVRGSNLFSKSHYVILLD